MSGNLTRLFECTSFTTPLVQSDHLDFYRNAISSSYGNFPEHEVREKSGKVKVGKEWPPCGKVWILSHFQSRDLSSVSRFDSFDKAATVGLKVTLRVILGLSLQDSEGTG